jgi:hypothetical protein
MASRGVLGHVYDIGRLLDDELVGLLDDVIYVDEK